MIFEAIILKKNLNEKQLELKLKDTYLRKIRYWIPKRFLKQLSEKYIEIDELFIFRIIEKIENFENKKRLYSIIYNSIIDPKDLPIESKMVYEKYKERKNNKLNRFLGFKVN